MGRPVAGSGHGDAARFTLFLGNAINEIAALIMGKFRYPVIAVWPRRTLLESRAGNLPVDEIARVQDGKLQRLPRRSRGRPVILSDLYYKRIGIVAREHGIGVAGGCR
jgi:hypothetical protein